MAAASSPPSERPHRGAPTLLPNARRLSIVIPVYDMASTLPGAIEAALNQLTAEDELVVVDDGSTDASGDIAASYPVRVVRLPANGGRAAARRAGAAAAHGRFLLFTDADAELLPGAAERMLAPLVDGRADVTVGVYSAEPKPRDLVSRFKNAWIRYTFLREADRIDFPFGCISAMARDLFLEASETSSWREQLEDFALGVELRGRGARFLFEPRAEVRHARSFSLLELIDNDFARARVGTRLALQNVGVSTLARERRLANIGAEFGAGALLGSATLLAAAAGKSVLAILALVAYLGVNLRLYRFLQSLGGPAFAAAGFGLLALSQAAAIAGGTAGVADAVLRRSRDAPAP